MSNKAKPLTDTQLLEWLRSRLEWDGRGYWLPEVCVREMRLGESEFPEPTLQEFRKALREHVRSA